MSEIKKLLRFFISIFTLVDGKDSNGYLSPDVVNYQPRHIHISLGVNSSSFLVTWSTINQTQESIVLIGKEKFTDQFIGSSKEFVDGGDLHSTQFIHTVLVNNVEPNSFLIYSVGSGEGWSPEYRLKTPQIGSTWSPTIALFGDMGNENAVSLPYLQKGALENRFDMAIHVGDFAYDMYEDNGLRGDVFMEQIESIASLIPYMTCPGNHEYHYNFSNYKARFKMPGDDGQMFYTFTFGPVRFFSVSTEYYYYYLEDGMVNTQYVWLKTQLQKANSPEERSKYPWIVVFGHRPMYCTNTDHDDCTRHETKTRVGFPPLFNLGMEDLLYDHGVDLAVWAHEHNYERLLPIYNRQMMPGDNPAEPYTNPGATVHITSGSAGCREKHDGFIPNPPAWSDFRSLDYGYTILKVVNTTHLHIEQMSVDKNKIIDQFWLIKHHHKSFNKKSYITYFEPFYGNDLHFILLLFKLFIFIVILCCIYLLVKSKIRLPVRRKNVYSKV